jgi:hypothetical protein
MFLAEHNGSATWEAEIQAIMIKVSLGKKWERPPKPQNMLDTVVHAVIPARQEAKCRRITV